MPNLLKARGLITYRNEINVAEGAMDVADNVVIDEDDVVEVRRGQADYGTPLPLETDRLKQILEYKDRLIRHYDSKLQFSDEFGNFSEFSGSYQELEDGLRIKYLEANGNFYFTDSTGIKKISAKDSSGITEDAIEDAGIPRAVSLEASTLFETSGFLPPQSKVAYRVLWGKKDNNNNLLLGYPSERFVISNTSKNTTVLESFNIRVKNIPTIQVESLTGIKSTSTGTGGDVDETAETVTITNHGMIDGQDVEVEAEPGGTLPGGLSEDTIYKVKVVDNSTVKFTTDGSSVVDLTAAAGTFTLKKYPTSKENIITFGSDEGGYFIWFDTSDNGDGRIPASSYTVGRTDLRVKLPLTITDLSEVTALIASAISSTGKFNVNIPNEANITVTSKVEGNIEDPVVYFKNGESSENLEATMLQQGSVIQGSSASVNLTFQVPEGIDDTYFYQVYRTSSVSVFSGASLSDIDPGDEMNLVDEGTAVGDNNVILSQIEVNDNIPEDFRSQAAFLYTNAISGESIIQANARPPVAKDITLFNGSNFYANTKTRHSISPSLVSVEPTRWVSGTSDFIIGNEDITRKYTAIGEARSETIELTDNTPKGTAFTVNSARDEVEYFFWYDENGETEQPSGEDLDNRVGVRILYNVAKFNNITHSYENVDNTFSEPDNTFRLYGHGLSNGDIVYFTASEFNGTVPAPITPGQHYTVSVVDPDTIQVKNNGMVVDIASPGGNFSITQVLSLNELAELTKEVMNSTGDFLVSTKVIEFEGLDSENDISQVTDYIDLPPGHGIVEGQEIYLTLEDEGSLPSQDLVEGEVYVVISVINNSIKISSNGVDAVDLTTETGTFTLTAIETGKLTVDWAKNGNVSQGVVNSANYNGYIGVTVDQVGDGENVANREFLLSNQVSVSQSIDETARSLVKVINSDTECPVNAYYVSSSTDVPGKIFLESKTLEDKPFYIATSHAAITNDFEPILTSEITILSTSQGSTSAQTVVKVDTNVEVGQELFFYDTSELTGLYFPNGKYSVKESSTSDGGLTYDLTIDAEATQYVASSVDGACFVASNESDNEESLNRVYFSKIYQPEAVPLTNFIDIGPRDKAISRILPLRDNLFALKEDGVYIISGSSAPNFTVRLLDSSTSIVAPDSAVVLNNAIYALSDDGVVRITDTGVEVISRNIEDLIKKVINNRFDFKKTSFGVSYTSDRSYLLWLPTNVTDINATQCYRYNTFTRTWTRFTTPATCGLVASSDDKMYLGSADLNVMSQERKNNDRTDYADRDFDLQILPETVNGVNLKVNNASDVKEGDVLYQEQYVTISTLKGLLRKLDIDSGVRSPVASSDIDSVNDVNVEDDTITIPSHGYESGREVTVYSVSGSLPENLENGKIYKVVVVDSDTIKLSLTESSSDTIDLEESAGPGTFTVNLLTLSYEDTITVEPGVKISSVIEEIITKLRADGVLVDDQDISDVLEEQRDQYNTLISQLNSETGALFKNYKEVSSLISYEMVVESVTSLNNSITLYGETPFVEGTVTVFKSIPTKWQYSPIHFGDPSSLKQVRQGTIIFDQNNFYGGTIAFATDQSADFVDVPFSGYGAGYWGAENWGNGTWGGSGNDIPHRTLLPLEKQRCRYLTVQIRHDIARENIRVNGISLMVRMIGNRAYR